MSLGKRLRAAREAKELTQAELGKRIDMKDATINKYEKETRRPDPQTLGRLADVLGVSTDYLLCRTDIPNFPIAESTPTPLPALDSWKGAKDFPDAYPVIIRIQAVRQLPFEWMKQTIDEALDYFHFELPKEGSQAAHTSGAASEGGSGISLGPGQVRKR